MSWCRSCKLVANHNLSIQCRACSFSMCHKCYHKGFVIVNENDIISICSINSSLDLNRIKSELNLYYSCEEVACAMCVNSIVIQYTSSRRRRGG